MRRQAFAGGFALLLVAGDATAAAQAPVTAEQAVAAQRDALANIIHPHCRPGGEEIVVCGKNNESERVPFPDEQADGSRTRLQPGEASNGVAALNASDPPCNSAGAPRCGFSISFITVGILLFKLGKHLADPDSDPPPTPIGAEPHPPE